MREIKFRAKRITNDIDSGKWVYGDLIHDDDSTRMGISNKDSVYEADINTIGQFTGLHDKNGTEIYEGDLIEVKTADKHFISEITWNESFGCYEFQDGEYSWCGLDAIIVSKTGKSIYGEFMEVIGNIHERSE